MAYCVAADVTAIVDTDMTDPEIGDLIDMIDALIKLKIVVAGLDALVLKALSQAWTAYRVMLKDASAERIGDLSSDRKTNLMLLKQEYEDLLATLSGGIAFTMTSDSIGT